MRIAHNISSMTTQGSLYRVNGEMTKSLEKLSTGYRINKAADDAAGLGVSENLRTQVRGMGQALKNTQDAISMLNIADGALNEQSSILQRMRELVLQAKNDTYTQTERDYMGVEFDAMVSELDRVANVTKFNKMQIFGVQTTGTVPGGDPKSASLAEQNLWPTDPLFTNPDDGSATYFNIMVGANVTAGDIASLAAAPFASNYYDSTAENFVTLRFGQMDARALLITTAADDTLTVQDWLHEPGLTNTFECDPATTFFGNIGPGGNDLQTKLSAILQIIDGDAPTSSDIMMDPVGDGTLNTTGLKRINTMRARVGAMTNRLESNVNNLMTGIVNQQAAESQIRDVDFAVETSNLTRMQILSQSATAMLAQANQTPQSILQLLR